jgi:hypothetical protein
MPCWRATALGEAPGARLSNAIDCFCSVDQRRRGSPRVISSMLVLRSLLRALLGVLVGRASGSVMVRSVSMTRDQHIRLPFRHVGSG